MRRQRALWMTIGILIVTSLACNAFSGDLESLPPPPTTVLDAQATSISSLAPTATLQSQLPGDEVLVTMLVDINIRNGPGVQYDRIGYILEGESAAVTGVHAATGWWQIACPENIEGSQCWVSGGEQYARADSVGNVPEITPPPTPTPIAPDVEQGTGFVVYIDDGRLYSIRLDLTKSPATQVDQPIQLSDVAEITSLTIAPDGHHVAFLAGDYEANALYVVNIDGQDQRLLLDSQEIPLSQDLSSAQFNVLIAQIQWLEGSKSLALNTVAVNQFGQGTGSQEDLWIVSLEGELQERFPAGSGGGAFIAGPSNLLFLGRQTAVARANLDGGEATDILPFDFINTASEYIYYPLPQLLSEGLGLVALPAGEPWESGAETALWQIPVEGPVLFLGSVEDVSLFDRVVWSPDGNRTAFITQSANIDEPQVSRLMIADRGGSGASAYTGGERLTFHQWGENNGKFLYSGAGFYAVGQENAPAQQFIIPLTEVVSDARWISHAGFLVASLSPEEGKWELHSADVGGMVESLFSAQGFNALFDAWYP